MTAQTLTNSDLLGRVLAGQETTFAVLHRPEVTGGDRLDLLVGELSTPRLLADLPLPEHPTSKAHHELLVVVPYRQIAERGFTCVDDGSPLLAITVTEQATVGVAEILAAIPDEPIGLVGGDFDIDDDSYADTVRRVIAEEIGTGEGANFVIKRSFVAEIADYGPRSALVFFSRLLRRERGAYWTFLVHGGGRTFVGASPERHISLREGTAVMNPISGTYRYPVSGPTLPELMDFLADGKEVDELYMVLDEELKMMAGICDGGGRIIGPYLKEMSRLAHTEYFIEGRTTREPHEILRETLFAPTVTGSPVESACRVISRYEPHGRGYYSGIVALIGRDAHGSYSLDSAILIRTADIDSRGRVEIGVGATVVRHSDPAAEVAETRAKAAGLLAALDSTGPEKFSEHPSVRAALAQRNTTIAEFWLTDDTARVRPDAELAGRRVLVLDAEDTFTSMINHQLRSMGLAATVRRFDEPYNINGYDLVVMGPGPGDPRDVDHPKIMHLSAAITTLLAARRPFVAVCLSHQVLSTLLGLPLVRRAVPNQGVQQEIDLFGSLERVGFYNTFAAHCAEDKVECDGIGIVEVSRDIATGEVHALRSSKFASMQFHPESVLTRDGIRIIGNQLKGILSA
jgi:phenazine biosynthesis protein phzE